MCFFGSHLYSMKHAIFLEIVILCLILILLLFLVLFLFLFFCFDCLFVGLLFPTRFSCNTILDTFSIKTAKKRSTLFTNLSFFTSNRKVIHLFSFLDSDRKVLSSSFVQRFAFDDMCMGHIGKENCLNFYDDSF